MSAMLLDSNGNVHTGSVEDMVLKAMIDVIEVQVVDKVMFNE